MSLATWVRLSLSAEILCRPAAILHDIEPISALKRALLSVNAVLSIIFFFLDFVSDDLMLTGF